MANRRRLRTGRLYFGYAFCRDAGDGSRDEHALRSFPHWFLHADRTRLPLFALWLISAEKLRLRRLLPGVLVMRPGISAMHYTGMAALQFASLIVWNNAWIALS